MRDTETIRLRQQSTLEQILTGLEEENPNSEARARQILGRIAYRGSLDALRRTIQGLLLTLPRRGGAP